MVVHIPMKKLILLVTYMRSGSSLTGDILQHSPGAFYAYEPFRSISKMNSSSATINYVNGTKRQPPFSITHEMKMALNYWFTCNLEKLPKNMLLDSFMKRGIKSKVFPECLNQTSVKTRIISSVVLHNCVKKLQQVCENSQTVVIKTIRMSIKETEYFLGEFPNLKLIHLIRDPRATLGSEAKLGMCSAKHGGLHGCTSNFCKRVENDVLDIERMHEKFGNRMKQVKYEHIAKDPIGTSIKMYEFLGLEFNKRVEEYIYNITMAGNPDDCLICTTRSNSSAHVDAWKTKMRDSFIEIINDRCNFIIKRFRFDKFPETQHTVVK